MSKNALSQTGPSPPRLERLQSLDLSGNKLVSLADGFFDRLPALSRLSLDDNSLKALPASICVAAATLEACSVANNKLRDLPPAICRLAALTHLNLRNNNLKNLPQDIWHCAKLQSLNVSSNLLVSFPPPPDAAGPLLAQAAPWPPEHGGGPDAPLPFPLCRSLRELYAGENRLTDDCMDDALLYLAELRVLNVSYNHLDELGPGLLQLHKLEELYLSGNRLTSLPEDLDRLRALRVLYVNGNRLSTVPSELSRNARLAVFDASENALKYNIANWKYDWNWNWNIELAYLNLAGNGRLEVVPPPSSSSLANAADEASARLTDFGSLAQLRLLDLSGIRVDARFVPLEAEHPYRVRWLTTEEADGSLAGPDSESSRATVVPCRASVGLADALSRSTEPDRRRCLTSWDFVHFGFMDKERDVLLCLFDGHHQDDRTAKLLYKAFPCGYAAELVKLGPRAASPPSLYAGQSPADALRRAFLEVDKQLAAASPGQPRAPSAGASAV
ncbi:MAG: leucine-rich repeat domain-containing protein, partial [Rhizomicrobium sp.]